MQPARSRRRRIAAVGLALAASFGIAALAARSPAGEEMAPPEAALGERLFLETRFSQYFAARCDGDVNAVLKTGDPAVSRTVTTSGSLPGPYAGEAMNCRACHLGDEQRGRPRGGVRTLSDFAARSPIPDRGDGRTTTLRNSPSLVDAARAFGAEAPYLHFDGEFASPEDLVVGTFTGRNFGWLATERDEAVAHIARVLRRDDGSGDLATATGGAYRVLLKGTDPRIPAEFRLPASFRIEPDRASDEEMVRAAARLVGAFLRSLHFGKDGTGRPAGSAFDAFLEVNGLPRRPKADESAEDYTDRLREAVADLRRPRWVTHRGVLRMHGRAVRFGKRELLGLRAFLARPEDAPEALSGTGNCAACHYLPEFTDREFHATGVSQLEYDSIHGAGAFLDSAVPGLEERSAAPESFLPPTPSHPAGLGPFASVPSLAAPGRADLGLWNVLLNPDVPGPQAAIRDALAEDLDEELSDAALLDRSLAAFKTPSLRDLGQSGPFLHDGSRKSIRSAVAFYREVSDLARAGTLRNGDGAMAGIRLDDRDERLLAAFLRSLDEDFD